LLLTLCPAFFLAGLARAQVAPGLPSFVPQDCHEVDCVDLLNNNISLRLPVRSKSGAFSFNFNLNAAYFMSAPSGTWISSSNQSTTKLQGSANNFLGSGVLGASTPITGVTCSSGSGTTTKYTNWVFYTNDGTGHPLPASDYTDDTSSNTSCLTGSGFTGAVSVDGSGFIVSMTANTQVISEYLRNGVSIGLSSPFKITDSNGNFVEQNGTTYTDTMGLTSLTTSGSFPTPTFTWTNVSGANVDVALTATSETLGTYFQCTSPSIAELSGSVSLPTGVSYPDGTSLGLSYEKDPHNSSDVTGRLNEITLREGGTISYTYGGSNNGINCAYQTCLS
jgi:hypothetical protein